MSRRRKGNKLLGRILLISLAAHVVLVPVLARMGVFEKVRRQFVTATVFVPPPERERLKDVAKQLQKKPETHAKKGNANRSTGPKNHLNQPKVASASASPGATDDAGPTVDPNGTGKAGVVPTEQKGSPAGSGNGEAANTTAAPVPVPPKTTQPEPAGPGATKPDSKGPDTVAPAPHKPVFGLAEPVERPQPEIPDDLRAEALDKTTVVLADIGADGAVTGAKVIESSGVAELDELAARAVKRWKFRPATRDGEPTGSHMRVHVRFKVD